MNELVWLFIGAMAFVVSTLAVKEGARLFRTGDGDATAETLGGVFGTFLWILWALGAMNVETVSNGSTVSTTHEPVALMGAVLAATMLVVAVDGAVRLFDVFESVEDPFGREGI